MSRRNRKKRRNPVPQPTGTGLLAMLALGGVAYLLYRRAHGLGSANDSGIYKRIDPVRPKPVFWKSVVGAAKSYGVTQPIKPASNVFPYNLPLRLPPKMPGGGPAAEVVDLDRHKTPTVLLPRYDTFKLPDVSVAAPTSVTQPGGAPTQQQQAYRAGEIVELPEDTAEPSPPPLPLPPTAPWSTAPAVMVDVPDVPAGWSTAPAVMVDVPDVPAGWSTAPAVMVDVPDVPAGWSTAPAVMVDVPDVPDREYSYLNKSIGLLAAQKTGEELQGSPMTKDFTKGDMWKLKKIAYDTARDMSYEGKSADEIAVGVGARVAAGATGITLDKDPRAKDFTEGDKRELKKIAYDTAEEMSRKGKGKDEISAAVKGRVEYGAKVIKLAKVGPEFGLKPLGKDGAEAVITLISNAATSFGNPAYPTTSIGQAGIWATALVLADRELKENFGNLTTRDDLKKISVALARATADSPVKLETDKEIKAYLTSAKKDEIMRALSTGLASIAKEHADREELGFDHINKALSLVESFRKSEMTSSLKKVIGDITLKIKPENEESMRLLMNRIVSKALSGDATSVVLSVQAAQPAPSGPSLKDLKKQQYVQQSLDSLSSRLQEEAYGYWRVDRSGKAYFQKVESGPYDENQSKILHAQAFQKLSDKFDKLSPVAEKGAAASAFGPLIRSAAQGKAYIRNPEDDSTYDKYKRYGSFSADSVGRMIKGQFNEVISILKPNATATEKLRLIKEGMKWLQERGFIGKAIKSAFVSNMPSPVPIYTRAASSYQTEGDTSRYAPAQTQADALRNMKQVARLWNAAITEFSDVASDEIAKAAPEDLITGLARVMGVEVAAPSSISASTRTLNGLDDVAAMEFGPKKRRVGWMS